MAFRTNKMPVLQTKSASGSVATFNTALAMPLVNGEFSIQAYQEGSGDPNPIDNIRPIHGLSEVNATRCGKNLFDYTSVTWEDGYLDDNQEYHTSTTTHYSSPFPITPNTTLTASGFDENFVSNIYMRDKNLNWLGRLSSRYTTEHHFTTPQNCYYLQIQYAKVSDGSTIQLEAGSQATSYEQYNGETVTVALGRTVYGGSYNSVTGKLIINRKIIKANDVNWIWGGTSIYHPTPDTDASLTTEYPNGKRPVMCNMFVYKPTQESGVDLTVTWGGYTNNKNLTVKYTTAITSLADWNNFINDNDVYFVYYIPPVDIQLTPQQIETLIGNNTIFADTGDVDLTFKDLDLAKRGNFREVFKLPN